MRVLAVALALGVLAFASDAGAQSILDFISFDGVHYIRWQEEAGRQLQSSDLGIEFATVECAHYHDRASCPFGRDAAAAYMPAGTRVYAVNGYRTNFRLAAVTGDRIFLYQAWRNGSAKVGADLYDVVGKVRAIDVQRGEPSPAAPARSIRIESSTDIDALVTMLVRGAVRAPSPRPYGEPRYWLTFWLADGTTLGRPFVPDANEILGGLVVPPEFRAILARYLGD